MHHSIFIVDFRCRICDCLLDEEEELLYQEYDGCCRTCNNDYEEQLEEFEEHDSTSVRDINYGGDAEC